MNFYFERFYGESDTVQEKQNKKILVSMISLSSVLTLFSVVAAGETFVAVMVNAAAGVISIAVLIKWFVTKRQTEIDRTACIFLYLFLILFADLICISEMREPLWPLAVLLVDAVLLCRMRSEIGIVIVVLVTVYLIVSSFERAIRFGFYDIVGTKMRDLRECFSVTPEEIAATPCKQGVWYSMSLAIVYIGVFLVDFYCTRSFAEGMHREKAKLESSISLAESVVSDLVRFDLDEAGQRIDMESITPLTETLSQLLRNLHQYRPYLPDSLFAEEVNLDIVLPPSGPSAAILFTDIKSSTAMWEAAPDAMKKALKTHNNIIRSCVLAFRGYEVKTIGDSFMVAFEALADGCAFAMDVQERLAEATWPSDLKLPPSMESQGWKGITIRIGLHYGEVETEVGEVSGRTDYFGRTVNRAARLESVCVPGGVAIDYSLLDQVVLEVSWYHTRISRTLKGIDEHPISIAVLLKHKDSVSDFLGSPSPGEALLHCRGIPKLEGMAQRKCATTCTARIEPRESGTDYELGINIALGKAILCTEMSEGSIVTLLSSSITIGWNTARVSSSHVENGLRFVSLMHANFSSSSEVFIGLSSSAVHCGRVGTRDQRFVTVFGSCVNLCGLLSQASYDIRAFALTTTTEQSPRYPFQRPIDCWNDRVEGPLLVCELHVERLKGNSSLNSSINRINDFSIVEEWGWSDDYWEAFHRRDWKAIDARTLRGDLILKKVAEMIQMGKSLRSV